METIKILSTDQLIEEEKIVRAVQKLKKYDKEAVQHLEMLADLAEKNQFLFKMGINILKQRSR